MRLRRGFPLPANRWPELAVDGSSDWRGCFACLRLSRTHGRKLGYPTWIRMSLKPFLVRACRGAMSRGGEFLARRLMHNFYLRLAWLFTAMVLLDLLVAHQVVDQRQRSYDFVMKNRLIK